MKILVCDDEKLYVETISANIHNYLNSKHISHSIDTFTDNTNIFKHHESYDMAFLDIEMMPANGIEIARELKKINPNAVIFIITSHNQYLDDALDLQVFRYIQKPLNIPRLFSGLDKALEIIENATIQFYLSDKSTLVRVYSNEIVYIEIVNRKTHITTTTNTYESNLSIKEWLDILPKNSFYMVHSSFIVNVNHITKYSRDNVILNHQHLVPISYRKQPNFKQFFLCYSKYH